MNTSPERENSNGSQTKKTFFSPLFRVTTVSKYFALLIFIAAPFFGGYVGYQIGHERNELSDSRISALPSAVTHQNELDINVASIYYGLKVQNAYNYTFDNPLQNIIVDDAVIATSSNCFLTTGSPITGQYLPQRQQFVGLSNYIADDDWVVSRVTCSGPVGQYEILAYMKKTEDTNVHVVGYRATECDEVVDTSLCINYGNIEVLY